MPNTVSIKLGSLKQQIPGRAQNGHEAPSGRGLVLKGYFEPIFSRTGHRWKAETPSLKKPESIGANPESQHPLREVWLKITYDQFFFPVGCLLVN